MDYQTGFFYLFSAVLLFAAFRVITARNPVHAVLFMMLAFSQAAAVWLSGWWLMAADRQQAGLGAGAAACMQATRGEGTGQLRWM